VRYRLFVVPAAGVAVVLLGVLLFGNLNGNLVYYLTPGEALDQRADFPDGRRFRLAGEVQVGSLRETGDGVALTLSDGRRGVDVVHRGAPPQLLEEGIQAVVEGAWQDDRFVSDVIIVKHEADYRPPEPVAGRRAEASR
jgi:cytochrome c-type biogenesis protein CcmE